MYYKVPRMTYLKTTEYKKLLANKIYRKIIESKWRALAKASLDKSYVRRR